MAHNMEVAGDIGILLSGIDNGLLVANGADQVPRKSAQDLKPILVADHGITTSVSIKCCHWAQKYFLLWSYIAKKMSITQWINFFWCQNQ